MTAAHQAQGSWARCCHFVIIEEELKTEMAKASWEVDPAGQ